MNAEEEKMKVRYDRVFSEEQLATIEKSEIPDLLRIIAALKVDCPTPEYAFDVHIREKSELMIYHGGTCLLIINCTGIKGKASDTVLFKSPSYGKGKGCDNEFFLFRGERKIGDINQLIPYICDFLAKVVATSTHAVHLKFYRNMKEGYWSSRLSIDYGRNWRPGTEWLIIDREAVLGFEEVREKSSFYQYKLETQKIKRMLQTTDPKKWGTPNPDGAECEFGDELDFLAIGPEKQLQCIELKHASYTSGIYWGPLQASVYLKAYSQAVDNISENIKKLVRQKVRLGLLPPGATELLPDGNFAQVEGILAIADVDKKLMSTCWNKAIKVNDKLDMPVKMLRSDFDGSRMKWVSSDCW